MEWIDRLNHAVAYIEGHLTEEIDYSRAAKEACCSLYHFQRMFAYMAGIPLSEYIRRRRMSLAAVELKEKGAKIMDIALKYGYQSPTAFNRAFQSVHEITPSAAKKKDTPVKFYPPLTFKIIVKGVEELNYRLETKEAFCITGAVKSLHRTLEENFQIVPQMWEEVSKDGTVEKLCAHMDENQKGVLGVSICKEGEEWRYMIGVVAKDGEIPGMTAYEIPARTWAVFPGKGVCPQAIQELERRIFTEWLPSSGYEYDMGPDVEWYHSPNPQEADFEVWVPVKG